MKVRSQDMLKRVVAYFVRALTLYSLLDHKKGLQKDQLSKRIHNGGTSKTAFTTCSTTSY